MVLSNIKKMMGILLNEILPYGEGVVFIVQGPLTPEQLTELQKACDEVECRLLVL